MALGAPDDIEMEKIAEDELAKLQRQFRLMEMDLAVVTSSALPTLRVQRHLLCVLTSELDEIMLELNLTKSPSNVSNSSRIQDKLSNLLAAHERYTAEVNEQKSQIKELDFLLRQVERETKALQSKGSKSENDYPKTITNLTMVSQLENRLDTTMKKYNAVNAENDKLRHEIDRLLLDRTSFNSTWKRLLQQLMDGKAQLLELVEQAIATCDQREDWCNKLETLKDKAALDYRKHCLEVRDLQRQLDHDLKLEEFLKAKGAVRAADGAGGAGYAKAEAKRLQQRELEMRTINSYVQTLQAVKEFTGEEDIVKLIHEFQRREEENYALFNYVNEVNSELKYMDDNVRQLTDTLVGERLKHEARSSQQEESLDALQQSLQARRDARACLQADIARDKEVLNNIMRDIQELASTLKCDAVPLLQLMGTKIDVTENNVRLYLKVVDKKILDIVETIQNHELRKRQVAEGKDKTPPSTRRKGGAPIPGGRSPRGGSPRRAPTSSAPAPEPRHLLAPSQA